MNLRLVYIREEDLDDPLVKTLQGIQSEDVRVLFFVELKEVDEKVIPMIGDLSKLRLRKAEARIRNWLDDHLEQFMDFEVLAFDGRPSRYNPSYKLPHTKEGVIHVFLDPKHEVRIAPYLKYNSAAHRIKYLSLGDFNDQNING